MDEFGKQLESQQEIIKSKTYKIGYADKKFYERFTNELSDYYKSGVMPKSLGSDEKYLLKCRQKKLDDMGIKAVENVSLMPFSDISGISFSSDKYTLKHLKRTFRRRLHLKYKNKKSFEKKQDVILETDLIYNLPNAVEDNEKLCCPVCGEISELKKLESGCENCGNSSFITDLFPKVKKFFYRKSNSVSILGILKTLIICCITGFLVGIPIGISDFISGISKRITKDTIMEAISCAFTSPFNGVMIGIVFAVFIILFRLIYDNVKISSLINKTTESKTKIAGVMLRHEKRFSYENFESKMIFLLEMILFNDQREKLTMCNLKNPVRQFNIVDSVYRGFIELKTINIIEDICEITFDIHMSDIYFDGKKFFERNDVFCMTVQKKISQKNDIGFEIKNVTCPLCKEHFDAFKEQECTFCGKEYDNRENDWTVTEFKLK